MALILVPEELLTPGQIRRLAAHTKPARDVEATANSLAKMIISWIDDGKDFGGNWREGLSDVIALRLKRLLTSEPSNG